MGVLVVSLMKLSASQLCSVSGPDTSTGEKCQAGASAPARSRFTEIHCGANDDAHYGDRHEYGVARGGLYEALETVVIGP